MQKHSATPALDGAARVRVGIEIAAPPERVWEQITDHEGTPAWVHDVESVRIERDGEPHNGLHTIRIVKFRGPLGGPISEEVTYFDPPRAFQYVLFKGMPGLAAHLGALIVDDLGNGRSRLRWEVDFVFKRVHIIRLFAGPFLKNFESVLKRGLQRLKAQIEAS